MNRFPASRRLSVNLRVNLHLHSLVETHVDYFHIQDFSCLDDFRHLCRQLTQASLVRRARQEVVNSQVVLTPCLDARKQLEGVRVPLPRMLVLIFQAKGRLSLVWEGGSLHRNQGRVDLVAIWRRLGHVQLADGVWSGC